MRRWMSGITLSYSEPSDVPGGEPTRTTILTTGGELMRADADDVGADGAEGFGDGVVVVVHRTPGIESALVGTDTAKPADAITFDGDVYRLSRYERMYPHRVRLYGERQQ